MKDAQNARMVKSKAVICEKCFLWTHYRCLGKTEEQIEREFPDQFVCKECTDKKVEEEQSKDKKAKKVSITYKRDTGGWTTNGLSKLRSP